MALGDEVRSAQRTMWDTFSAGWEKWDPVIQMLNGPVGNAIVDSLGVGADQQHLDVAAGTGEPGLTVARLAPRGRVVLSDISPKMLEAAGRRAEALGLDNVELQECSADALPFDDDVFDSVSVRFGFMFFPDLEQTAAELARVLKPGGRLCAAVWAGPDDNPWATIAGTAIASEIEQPAPDPDAPGMFRCAAPGKMTELFETVGLHDVRDWDVPMALTSASPEEYWRMVTELTAPVVAALSAVDQPTRDRIGSKVVDAASAYATSSGVSIPATARCVLGTK